MLQSDEHNISGVTLRVYVVYLSKIISIR